MALTITTVGAQPALTDLQSLEYRSAFADYRKFDAQPVAPWVETNATVAGIGGWRTYAREAHPSGAEIKIAPVPSSTSKPSGSSGARGSHEGHGGKP